MSAASVNANVLKELIRQIDHERFAAENYLQMSLWCEDQNFKGFARFFKKQCAEEREHAEKLIDHMLDRGVMPQLGELAKPRQKFDGLAQVAAHAQAMERENTLGINKVYEAALAVKDYPVQVLMQWFISEQVEEEDWCAEMVDRVDRANCAGALSELDRHIEKYLAGDED